MRYQEENDLKKKLNLNLFPGFIHLSSLDLASQRHLWKGGKGESDLDFIKIECTIKPVWKRDRNDVPKRKANSLRIPPTLHLSSADIFLWALLDKQYF